jgi:hypothetical protein
MMQEEISALLLYVRLMAYPLLVYSLLVYTYTVLYDKHKEFSKLVIALSVVFVLLWCSSIIYFITHNNALVVDFNSLSLVPTVIVIIIYIWIQTCKYCRVSKGLRSKKDGDETNF